MSPRLNDPVRLGVVVGVRGIKGEVRIKSFTDDPMDITAYGVLSDQSGERQFEIKALSVHKGAVIARIKGIEDRNAAEALKRTELFIERSNLPAPEEDEFYNSDLEGLKATSVDGKDLGKVKGVFEFGAGPILELSGNIMVPFTREVVPEVDIEGGKVLIDPPEGLFDPPDPEMGKDKEETT